ncbi:head maturation protease, ClpP-related [Ruegeria jejuensis]|uniref:head maturation protease, ClpP-related n=1 Tax=Ruegeria jejuensis TaxID=3233338 RepID=UPI00355B52B6
MKTLPEIKAFDALSQKKWSLRNDAVSNWDNSIHARENGEEEIDIYGVIGEDFWDESTSMKDVATRLEEVGPGDVVVNINSPGGSYFDGVGIYNALRQHKGKVTIRVLGLAASAASVIAMAGDEIQMGEASTMMIHKAWGVTIGNADDNRDAAEVLDKFDASMSKLYATRMDESAEDVLAMMSKDTFFSAEEAIEAGLADGFFGDAEIEQDAKASSNLAATRAELLFEDALRAQHPNMTRSERRALRSDMKGGKLNAAPTVKPSADDLTAALNELAKSIHS